MNVTRWQGMALPHTAQVAQGRALRIVFNADSEARPFGSGPEPTNASAGKGSAY